MRRMILLFFIGAVFVYALAFMAILVGLMAVALSLCIYAATYVVSYWVAKIKHRASPEWKFDKRPWTPDLDMIQGIAIVVGVFSLAGMVVLFFAYAFSDGDWGTSIGVTVFFLAIAGMFGLIEMKEERDRQRDSVEPVDPTRPWSSKPKS